MGKRIYSPFFIISLVSVIVILAISINLSPLLLGPDPYPPDWRWTYQFSATFNKIWFPLIVIITILLFAYKTEKINESEIKKNQRFLLTALILLGFLLQIGLLFYSRSGLGVMIHRIINPLISGYFTASLDVQNILEFIRGYNENLGNYPMYAKFHPPGAILLFNLITTILQPLSPYFASILNHVPSHPDVALVWQSLSYAQRLSAIASGFAIALLANITIIPLYFCSKLMYGERIALRSAFLFLFVPAILLFTPLIDVFLPLFSASCLYFFLRGVKNQKNKYFFISGFILFLGVFFSLTFLPLLLFLFLLFLFAKLKKQTLGVFLVGFVIIPVLLFFSGLDFIKMTQKIMQYHELAQSGRGHLVWFFYNIYDFLLFAGIPLGLFFFYQLYSQAKSFIKLRQLVFKKRDTFFLAFTIMLFAVDVSGAVRGETARIWIPFTPLLVVASANFLTNKLKLKFNEFIFLLTILAVQLLIFQTVLVTVW